MWFQRAVGHVCPQVAMCSQQRLLVCQEGRYRNKDSSGSYQLWPVQLQKSSAVGKTDVSKHDRLSCPQGHMEDSTCRGLGQRFKFHLLFFPQFSGFPFVFTIPLVVFDFILMWQFLGNWTTEPFQLEKRKFITPVELSLGSHDVSLVPWGCYLWESHWGALLGGPQSPRCTAGRSLFTEVYCWEVLSHWGLLLGSPQSLRCTARRSLVTEVYCWAVPRSFSLCCRQ